MNSRFRIVEKAAASFISMAVLSAMVFSMPAGRSEAAEAPRDENPHLWEPTPKSVAVFKNGMGFFIREGEVRLRDGWCMAQRIPPAAFGTLAVYSHDDDTMVDIVGAGPGEVVEFDGVDAPDSTEARRKRLQALEHMRIEIGYTHKGAERRAAGALVGIGPTYAVLENEQNSFAVPIEPIERIQVLDTPLRVHVSGDEEGAPQKARLGMAYLRKGITWIPEYTLRVIDDETAELTLRGTLVNEAEDLVHCDVHLVVGVPHFLHNNYMAPIAVGQVIRTIGAAVAPPHLTTQIMNRAAVAQHRPRPAGGGVIERRVEPGGGDLGGALGGLPQMAGPGATDYTVYTRKDMTLRRGEKAIVTLFTKTIRYRHVYRWSPPGEIEHYLALPNDTDTAWTTGPCLAISKQHPLGEDLLKYTARGDTAELPVTAAVNIAHNRSEKEVDRRMKAHMPTRHSYLDLVTLEGTLVVENFEKHAVDLRIEAPVKGHPIEASDSGTLHPDPTQLVLTKRAGTVRWRLTIEPGKRRTVTYRYRRYVPSQ